VLPGGEEKGPSGSCQPEALNHSPGWLRCTQDLYLHCGGSSCGRSRASCLADRVPILHPSPGPLLALRTREHLHSASILKCLLSHQSPSSSTRAASTVAAWPPAARAVPTWTSSWPWEPSASYVFSLVTLILELVDWDCQGRDFFDDQCHVYSCSSSSASTWRSVTPPSPLPYTPPPPALPKGLGPDPCTAAKSSLAPRHPKSLANMSMFGPLTQAWPSTGACAIAWCTACSSISGFRTHKPCSFFCARGCCGCGQAMAKGRTSEAIEKLLAAVLPLTGTPSHYVWCVVPPLLSATPQALLVTIPPRPPIPLHPPPSLLPFQATDELSPLHASLLVHAALLFVYFCG